MVIDQLKIFIYSFGWGYTLPFPLLFKKTEINRDTQLLSDLKITGDDADEFLLAFSNEFKVDISSFKIDEYFSDEEDYVSSTFKDLFRNKYQGKKPLTVSHLEKAILVGRLDEDIMGS